MDADNPQPVTGPQAEALRRAIGLMVTWHEADQSASGFAAHREHLRALLDEDDDDAQDARLVQGLIILTGQLLTTSAHLADVHELHVLQAIAESYVASAYG